MEEGIVFTADPAKYRRALRALLKAIRIWSGDWRLVTQYGRMAKMARERGRSLSLTDLILAAFAREEDMVLLTADKDFEAFPEIKTEDWTGTT